MVRNGARKDSDVAHRRIVQSGYEAVHRTRVASHYALFERHSPSESDVKAIRIHKAVCEVFYCMTASARMYGIFSGLARETLAIFISKVKEVIAVLRCPCEIAVGAEIIKALRSTKLLPSWRRRNVEAKRRDA